MGPKVISRDVDRGPALTDRDRARRIERRRAYGPKSQRLRRNKAPTAQRVSGWVGVGTDRKAGNASPSAWAKAPTAPNASTPPKAQRSGGPGSPRHLRRFDRFAQFPTAQRSGGPRGCRVNRTDASVPRGTKLTPWKILDEMATLPLT